MRARWGGWGSRRVQTRKIIRKRPGRTRRVSSDRRRICAKATSSWRCRSLADRRIFHKEQVRIGTTKKAAAMREEGGGRRGDPLNVSKRFEVARARVGLTIQYPRSCAVLSCGSAGGERNVQALHIFKKKAFRESPRGKKKKKKSSVCALIHLGEPRTR